jgi:hypothetical protein
MEIKGYVVVTQFDTGNWGNSYYRPDGPLVHETYMGKAATLEMARKRAKDLRGKFGWAYVAYVNVDTESFYNKEDAAEHAANLAARGET